MVNFDITQPIVAYSTHFFPPDAAVPIFITVYKTGSATADDVAGYLMFTDHPVAGHYSDWISSEHQYIVKHFRFAQFDSVLSLLKHRLDYQKQPMGIHYVGDKIVGGWTTLDAGASPGLDSALMPLVMTPTPKSAAQAVEKAKTTKRRGSSKKGK